MSEKEETSQKMPSSPLSSSQSVASVGANLPKHKVVFLGDQSVGKTSIITRYMYDTFEATYQATIGIDFLSKTVHLEDRTIRLQIWDTAGQERFRSLIPSYVRDSAVAIVVFDVTNKQTFVNSKSWIDIAKTERGDDVIIALVGNKTDLKEKRQVTTEEAEAFAKDLKIMYTETSARAGFNVRTLFRNVASKIPGVEGSVNPHKTELQEIKLTSTQPAQQTSQDSSCGC
eukprot:TRINITY_DN9866_c0_g2_i1.p1 TRINITY_DN9866_c0_g2~~TRINITY_DN9866_c0_g2_i1.p1  ORF type:complete len:229 (+),score=59.36 TRINITY_DN9866_c0_g2_i1:139-825(+)